MAPAETRQAGPVPTAPRATPRYEEPSLQLVPEPTTEKVNDAVFAALREIGVDPLHTHLVVNLAAQGELADIQAELAPNREKELRAILERTLRPLGVSYTWEKQQGGLILEVSKDQRLTNRLILLHPSPQPQIPADRTPPAPHPSPLPGPGAAPTALVIDDLGYDLEAARRLLALDLPLTFSILPHSPFGAQIAHLAQQKGVRVLLHLPMEPQSYPQVNPGPGTLLLGMSPAELRKKLLDDLASVPRAEGVNNHMGSAFTEDEAALEVVFRVLKERGLFFLDSLTSARSRAQEAAARVGLPFLKRSLFLDHVVNQRYIRSQLNKLLAAHPAGEPFIAIGHPHAETIAVLEAYAPRLRRLALVPLRDLVHPGAAVAGDQRAGALQVDNQGK